MSEAIIKGIPGIDVDEAWDAIVHVANSDIRGLPYHRELKAIPSDAQGQCVGMGFELCVGDGHIALLAKHLGKKDEAIYFSKRARNYRLYWDPEVKFYRGKTKSGEWHRPWDPMASLGEAAACYTEGNAYSYLFLMPQDVEGMIKFIGGEEVFTKRYDEYFTIEFNEAMLQDLTGLIGQYVHGNEHAHHLLYIWAYAGQQWKTAKFVRLVLNVFYQPNELGVVGNEDCGAMSSWYIMSTLGFYPVFPASCEYVFGSPALEKAVISVGDGKTLTVQAPGTSTTNRYIQSVTLNGKAYTKSYITHADILAGGEIVFEMGETPNESFGSKPEDRPHSSMDDLGL